MEDGSGDQREDEGSYEQNLTNQSIMIMWLQYAYWGTLIHKQKGKPAFTTASWAVWNSS